jgi:shikimate dehydrogenase
MVGAGGVGRAIAFGLVALGMERLHLVDQNPDKAEGLAADLKQIAPHIATAVHRTAGEAALGVNGLINSTPIGMVGYEGSVFRGEAMRGKAWAFDAVYTPVDTHFLRDAESAGLNIISGYELFFFQGVHAWDIFTGFPLDHAQLRRTLLEAG